MKKVLIIHAHPEKKSFCAALKNETVTFFEQGGDQVRLADLYASNFNPVGGKDDFITRNNSEFFKYQREQVHAFENNLFTADLKQEMDNLEWCDILIFSFPLWWFGLPAILKGWVDRVFAMGFVYGNGKGVYENGVYAAKTAMLLLTTGGPEMAYNGGKNGDLDTILFPIHHGIFYFAGMTVAPPFISFAPARKSDAERAEELQRLQNHLANMDNLTPIYTNK